MDASIDAGWLVDEKGPEAAPDEEVGADCLGDVGDSDVRKGDDSGPGESDGNWTGGIGERASVEVGKPLPAAA